MDRTIIRIIPHHARHPDQILRRLALLLFLGAIVAIAIAWFLSYFPPRPTFDEWSILEAPDGFEAFGCRSHAIGAEDWVVLADIPPAENPRILAPPLVALPRPSAPACAETAFRGWPLHCLLGTEFSPQRLTTLSRRHPIPLTRPVWPGLAADTLLYAALLGTLGATLAKLRQALHRRRGRCPGCGYDLRGAPPPRCPECGNPRVGPGPQPAGV